MQVFFILSLLIVSLLPSLAPGMESKNSGADMKSMSTDVTPRVNMAYVGSSHCLDVDKVLASINSSHVTHIMFRSREYFGHVHNSKADPPQIFSPELHIAARGGIENPKDPWLKLFRYKQKNRYVKILLSIPSMLYLKDGEFVKVMLDGGFDGLDFGEIHGLNYNAQRLAKIRQKLKDIKGKYGGYHFLIHFGHPAARSLDYKTLLPILDYCIVMDYTRASSFDEHYGEGAMISYHAPLFHESPETTPNRVNESTVSLTEGHGIPKKKLVSTYPSRSIVYPRTPSDENPKLGHYYSNMDRIETRPMKDIRPPRFYASCSDRAQACMAQDTILGDLATLENDRTVTSKALYARSLAGLGITDLENDYTGPDSLLSSASRGHKVLDSQNSEHSSKIESGPQSGVGLKNDALGSVAHLDSEVMTLGSTSKAPHAEAERRLGHGVDHGNKLLSAGLEKMNVSERMRSGFSSPSSSKPGPQNLPLFSRPDHHSAPFRPSASLAVPHNSSVSGPISSSSLDRTLDPHSAYASGRKDKYGHFARLPESTKNHPELVSDSYLTQPTSSDYKFSNDDHPERFSSRGYLGPKPTDSDFPKDGCAPNGTVSNSRPNQQSHGVSPIKKSWSPSGWNSSILSDSSSASAKDEADADAFDKDDSAVENEYMDVKTSLSLPLHRLKPSSDSRTHHSVGIGLSQYSHGMGPSKTASSAWSNSSHVSSSQDTDRSGPNRNSASVTTLLDDDGPDSDISKPLNIMVFRSKSLPLAGAVTSAPSLPYDATESDKPNMSNKLGNVMSSLVPAAKESFFASSTDRIYPPSSDADPQPGSRESKSLDISTVRAKPLSFWTNNATALPGYYHYGTARSYRLSTPTRKLQPMSTPTSDARDMKIIHPNSAESAKKDTVHSCLSSVECATSIAPSFRHTLVNSGSNPNLGSAPESSSMPDSGCVPDFDCGSNLAPESCFTVNSASALDSDSGSDSTPNFGKLEESDARNSLDNGDENSDKANRTRASSRLLSTSVTAEYKPILFGEQVSANSDRKVRLASSAKQTHGDDISEGGTPVTGVAAQLGAKAVMLAAMLLVFA